MYMTRWQMAVERTPCEGSTRLELAAQLASYVMYMCIYIYMYVCKYMDIYIHI
jgi:hypothetical protein